MGMPVDNLIAPGVDNEVARLTRQEYQPTTRPGKADAEYEAAARMAKHILLYDLKEMIWPDAREEFAFDFMACGTAIGRLDVGGEGVPAPDCCLSRRGHLLQPGVRTAPGIERRCPWTS